MLSRLYNFYLINWKRFGIALFLGLFFMTVQGYGSIRTASTPVGDWDVPGSWSPSGVPTYGDTIVIPAGKRIEVTSQQNYNVNGTKMYVLIAGTLFFTHGDKLELPCNSVVAIKAGGVLDDDHGGGNSDYIKICDATVWKSANGTVNGPACYPVGSAACTVFLPVEMLSLSAEWNKNHSVNVEWTTATEVNNARFEIWRASDDLSFSQIGSVAGHGNSSVAISYSFTDDGASSVKGRHIYYLLKQVDYDGNFKYYGPVSVKVLNSKTEIVLYPNPVHSNSALHLILKEKGSVDFELVDGLGRIVFSQTISSPVSDPPVIITLPRIASGMYTAIIRTADFSEQKKLIIND